MKPSEKCPKCSGTKIVPMNLSPGVSVDFGTFHLGDIIVPKLYICIKCGFSECWIDSEKELDDIRNFVQTREKNTGDAT